MHERQRKTNFVDQHVQGALVKRMVLQWCTLLVIVCAASASLQVLANPFRSLSEHTSALWASQGPLFVVLLFLFPVFVWDLVKFSNRFVGPVYRLRNGLQTLADGGRPAPITLRDDDFWQDLPVVFNQALDRLPKERNVAPAESALTVEPTAQAGEYAANLAN